MSFVELPKSNGIYQDHKVNELYLVLTKTCSVNWVAQVLTEHSNVHRATVPHAVFTKQQFRKQCQPSDISSTESPVVTEFRTTRGG